MTRARDVANLIGSGNYSSTTFTATAGQTVFSIAHTQNFVQVFMNGLLLDLTVDYTSNGSAVTLTSGAAAGDEIEVVAYNTFSVGDALNQAAADTRYVNATGDTMSGALTINTASSGLPSVSLQHSNSGADNFQIMAGTPGVANSGFSIRDTDASANRLIIDSSGYVTMPNLPAFMVGNVNITSPATGLLVFNQVVLNRGNHYSTSNHRFTAPVTAAYHIHFHGFLDTGSTSAGQVEFRINGNASGWTGVGAIRSYDGNAESGYGPPISISATVQLSVNDYVDVNTSGVGLHGNQGAYFGGYLIG